MVEPAAGEAPPREFTRVLGASRRVRVPKSADLVALDLRRRIVRGELKEGDALPPEGVLLEQFGVSRPTLREALRVLESEALITIYRGSHGGARVQAPDGDVAARYAGLVLEYRGATLADLFEAAAAIEGPAVGLAATRRTSADLSRLRKAVEREEEAVTAEALVAAQITFHELVIQLARNETLTMLAQMVRYIIDTATRRAVERNLDAERLSHTGSRAHRTLFDLIRAKDAAGAEALWRRHVVETSKYLQELLDTTSAVDLLD
jgi:GntR family transcriptional regulator, transcriptional repressor for pyruvate dehydrogenase complex